METIFNRSENWLKIMRRQWGKYVLDKWSDTLLFNRKSFETDKCENLYTDVLIMSCDKMNTDFTFGLQYENDQIK